MNQKQMYEELSWLADRMDRAMETFHASELRDILRSKPEPEYINIFDLVKPLTDAEPDLSVLSTPRSIINAAAEILKKYHEIQKIIKESL